MIQHLKPSGNYMYHIDILCIRTEYTHALCMMLTISTVSLCNNTRLVCLTDRDCVVWEIQLLFILSINFSL
jgi:hypothetical protein